jgi:hypothetical protein
MNINSKLYNGMENDIRSLSPSCSGMVGLCLIYQNVNPHLAIMYGGYIATGIALVRESLSVILVTNLPPIIVPCHPSVLVNTTTCRYSGITTPVRFSVRSIRNPFPSFACGEDRGPPVTFLFNDIKASYRIPHSVRSGSVTNININIRAHLLPRDHQDLRLIFLLTDRPRNIF